MSEDKASLRITLMRSKTSWSEATTSTLRIKLLRSPSFLSEDTAPTKNNVVEVYNVLDSTKNNALRFTTSWAIIALLYNLPKR